MSKIKQVVYGMLMLVMCLFFLMGIMTIESRTNRENDVQKSLKRATDNAVTSILENQSYSVSSNEEFVASLTAMICDSLISYDGSVDNDVNSDGIISESERGDMTTMDENLKLTIEIVEADYIKGLLSLNIVEEYTNPIGSIGTCEYSTTVIFDEAKIYDTYKINYFDANGIIIESYIIRAGDNFPTPSFMEMASDGSGIYIFNSNPYSVTAWYTTFGGGNEFIVPEKVPIDSAVDNITKYENYDDVEKSLNLYGNYMP